MSEVRDKAGFSDLHYDAHLVNRPSNTTHGTYLRRGSYARNIVNFALPPVRIYSAAAQLI